MVYLLFLSLLLTALLPSSPSLSITHLLHGGIFPSKKKRSVFLLNSVLFFICACLSDFFAFFFFAFGFLGFCAQGKMGFLFSKKKKKDNSEHFAEDDVKKGKSRVSQHDKAVLDLKVQRDKLKAYQKRVCSLSLSPSLSLSLSSC